MGLLPICILPYGGQVADGEHACLVQRRQGRATKPDVKTQRGPGCLCPLLKSQLPAHHIRIQLSPAATTDGAPLSPVIHLQATLMVVLPTGKSEDPICGEKETQTRSKIILRKGQNSISISLETAPDLGLSGLFCATCPALHSLAWSRGCW